MTGPPGPCGCGCALTEATSIGFDQTRFATEVLAHPDDPWQRWAKIHAGELLPDGSQRFRYRLILASRQNGKSEILVGLVPYWMFVERKPQSLVTSTKVFMAKKLWGKSRKVIESSGLRALLDPRWYRETNGEVEMWTPMVDRDGRPWDSRYGVDASNEEGGRSLSIHRLAIDELRHHYDYSAWGALVRTMGAVDDAHAWLFTNAGSDRSVVLNDLRAAAVTELDDGTEVAVDSPDTDLFLAEWSAPAGADPMDVHALALANPNMNRRGQKARDLLADAKRAVEAGGEALTEYQTEVMCIRVKIMNPAINPNLWKACADPGTLDDVRSRIALCLDLAPDEQHATLSAAAVLADGRVRGEAVAAWPQPGRAGTCTEQMWADMPELLARIKPAKRGWFPAGPAASQAAKLGHGAGWDEIKSETPAVCMGLAAEVKAGTLAHSDDPLYNAHVGGAERRNLPNGTWVFSRRGEHCDGAYSLAGAVHLARTLPPPIGKPRLIVAE